MKLSDMLEYTGAYLDDRTEIISGDTDELWPDTLLVRWMNEAQRQLARAAWCIIDTGNPTAGVITLKTGVAIYPLHKSVLYVYDAQPSDQNYPLTKHDDLALRLPYPYTDSFWAFDINDPNVATPGRPLAISTDVGTRQIRVFRTPSSTENGLQLILRVARKPLTWLTLDDTDAEPEVPEDYHLQMCEYAAGKALTQPNVDGQQKQDGRLLLAEFKANLLEARRDRQRLQMNPAGWAFQSTTAVIK